MKPHITPGAADTSPPAGPSSKPRTALFIVLLGLVCLNLSWEHQTILIQMVNTTDYYGLRVREPFILRILPALIYRLVTMGGGHFSTGLNPPFGSSYEIFQLMLDSVSLMLTFVFLRKIAKAFNPGVADGVLSLVVCAGSLVIVIFGFFMVPNRALFYPYDFPDMCLATVIFFLCIELRGPSEWFLPLAMFLATLNKETAVFYSGLYLAMRIGKSADWRRLLGVMAACLAAAVAARAAVIWMVPHWLSLPVSDRGQYQIQLGYTLQQFRNPLFVFAMLNVCSYLYIPVFLLRKRFDLADQLIILMILAWIMIMSTVGVVRELRIFVPMSLLLFIVILRHLRELLALLLGERVASNPKSAGVDGA